MDEAWTFSLQGSICPPRPRRPALLIDIGPVATRELTPFLSGKPTMLKLTDVQKVKLTIDPRTAAGNLALVDGAPAFAVSDPEIATISADATNPNAAWLITTGKLGNVQVQVTADADLGAGVTTLTGVLDVEVIASQAVTLGIAAGEPEPRV